MEGNWEQKVGWWFSVEGQVLIHKGSSSVKDGIIHMSFTARQRGGSERERERVCVSY